MRLQTYLCLLGFTFLVACKQESKTQMSEDLLTDPHSFEFYFLVYKLLKK